MIGPLKGWYELCGHIVDGHNKIIDRRAIAWSLLSYKRQETHKKTLIVNISDYYNYSNYTAWASIPEDEVVILDTNQNLLSAIMSLCETEEFGQVLIENLGFLLGSGQLVKDGKLLPIGKLLGDISFLFKLVQLAESLNMLFVTTSHIVSMMRKDIHLGGNLLSESCYNNRWEVKRKGYLHNAGLITGNVYTIENLQTPEECVVMKHRFLCGPCEIQKTK